MPTLNATINHFNQARSRELSCVCKDRKTLLQQINKIIEEEPKASSFVFVVVPRVRK
jgi:hypothetical protein